MQPGRFAAKHFDRQIELAASRIEIAIRSIDEELDMRMAGIELTQPRHQPAQCEGWAGTNAYHTHRASRGDSTGFLFDAFERLLDHDREFLPLFRERDLPRQAIE